MLKVLEKAKGRPDGWVCALALIKRTNQAMLDGLKGEDPGMRAIIQSRAHGSGRVLVLGSGRRVGICTAIRRDPRRAGHLDDIDPRRRLSGSLRWGQPRWLTTPRYRIGA